MSTPTQDQLEEALAAAGSAHHEYEQAILDGKRDELWSGFYAAYVLGRLGDFAAASTLSRWLEAAPNEANWAAAASSYVLSRVEHH